jgi:hypothetical protein
MGPKYREPNLNKGTMSKLNSTRCQVEQAMDYELHTRCRNTKISRQPEEIQDIRIEEGME